MRPRLVLVLGDQLSEGLSALEAADPARDIVVMAEVMAEARSVPHHPRKIVLVLAAMRKFAERLRALGWRVAYTQLDEDGNSGAITGELLRRAEGFGAAEVLATRRGEWRLTQALAGVPLVVTMLPDDRFLCPATDFADWAAGRKVLRMEHFYRRMRQRTGYLMEGDTPAGGQWNFDHENRKPAKADLLRAPPLRHEPDAVTQAVIDLVQARFADHFGTLTPFWFATDREGALRSLEHFLTHHLRDFGTYQDAMLAGDGFLHHALISPYLNIGLLSPAEVCDRVEA